MLANANSFTSNSAKAIGLHYLVEEMNLHVSLPAVRSEAVGGARKTHETHTSVLNNTLHRMPQRAFGGTCALRCVTSPLTSGY